MLSPHRFAHLRHSARKRTRAREFVGRLRQEEQLVGPLAATIHRLTNPADRLAAAEHLLGAFALALADGITGPACLETSIVEPPPRRSFFATCGVTRLARQLAMKPAAS